MEDFRDTNQRIEELLKKNYSYTYQHRQRGAN